MTRDVGAGREDTTGRRTICFILAIAAGIELLGLLWLIAGGRTSFMGFIWTPDSPGYYGVASRLADTFTLTAGPRTLGYPLVLAVGELVGGRGNGPYVVIALQLILNIGFTWGCWRLLQRIVPDAGVTLRALATLFFFWAGLGMALYLMTDFLAAAFFALFLYGMLFWRTRSGVLLGGASLALATLTRPTFTLIPLLLPAAAFLIGRVTSKVPWPHLLVFSVCSLCATGVSVAYQYTFNEYLGPSPFLTTPIQEILYYGVVKHQAPDTAYPEFKKTFARQVEQRAGRPYDTLSLADREEYSKQILHQELMAHPREIILNVTANFLKYLFVPVESLVYRLPPAANAEQRYLTYVRPILGLMCLPIWCLSLIPPIGSSTRQKMYYLLAVGFVVYVIGLSSIGTGSGERIRFPVLVFMLAVTVQNAHGLHGYLHARIANWRGRQQILAA